MKRLALVATIVLARAAPAFADPEEGRACETTSDCGGLHCVEGTCVAIENGKVRTARELPTQSESPAMFGDGHGYVTAVVVGDVAATAATGLLLALSFATGSAGFAVASVFPTTLTGPIIHAVNGRAAPAAISFFAWASAPPTTLGAGFLGGVSTFNIGVALLAGTITGVACAAGLTALDAYLARPMKARPRSFSLMPSIAPTRDGLSASLVGTF